SRIAGEHAMTSAPPVRVRDRVGVDVPASGGTKPGPRRTHPDSVANVEDVRIAVGEKRVRLTVRLHHHELHNLGESSLGLGLTAKFGDDGAIHRRFGQSVVAEIDLTFHSHLGLTEEPVDEALAEVGDRDRRVLLGEELARDQLLRGLDLDGAGGGEDETRRLVLAFHEKVGDLAGEVRTFSENPEQILITNTPISERVRNRLDDLGTAHHVANNVTLQLLSHGTTPS
ncbi:MAG: hypothetical protein AAB467_01920, partial [Patescibacteria group bacterium]